MNLLTLIAVLGAVLCFAAYLILRFGRYFAALSDAFLRLPPSQKAVLVIAVTVATVSAQKGGTNGVDQAASPNGFFLTSGGCVGSPLSVTPEEVARGYRLESVSTNAAFSYAMPSNATVVGTWHLTGAYEDVAAVPLPFIFPIAGNEYDAVWAYTWGKIRPHLRDASNEIAAVGAPMSAIPGRSRFWTAATTNNSCLLTWEDFAEGRVRKAEVESAQAAGTPLPPWASAQIELFSTGDFITRSNGIERICRRIDPNDWDGDGWHNDDDWNPYEWDDAWDDFWQELPAGANTNAYCWIDVRCDYHSSVSFSGDGDSNLVDPSFTALAGRTYRVTLLIGKTYEIESDHPLTVIAKSSDEIEVDGNGTCAPTVVWPVDLYALEGNGRGFRMIVIPQCLGGRFTWNDSCCPVYGENNIFRYGCDGNCGCSGCYATGCYAYEGYWLSAEGGWCGCLPYHNDPDASSPGASVSFSKSVIFLEDEYVNAPGDTVPWQSTDTELTCTASGGSNGGYVTFEISGGANLVQYTGNPLPYRRAIAPNETLRFVNRYKATAESSSADDIVVTATFTENETGWVVDSEAKATAVKVEIEPLITVNNALHRHTIGVREEILVNLSPSGIAMIETGEDWNVLHSSSSPHYQCPIIAAIRGITVKAGEASYEPALEIIEPEGIICGSVTAETYGLSSGHAGGIGMWMPLHVTPSMVSFSNIAMVEEATDSGSATGYFTNPIFSGSYSHSVVNGAGVWHNIAGENFFFDDHPAMMGECPSPWSDGSIIWEIPIAWGERNSYRVVDKVSNVPYQAQQTFAIDPQGGVMVEKFGYWVKRAVGGLVTGSANVMGL